jgi:hypothetical protein
MINIQDEMTPDNFNMYYNLNTYVRFNYNTTIFKQIKYNSTDIIVSAYPKTGNTWLEYILLLLIHKNDNIKLHPEICNLYTKINNIGKFFINYIEQLDTIKTQLNYYNDISMFDISLDDFDNYKYRRVIKSHYSCQNFINYDIINNNPLFKIIIIKRNPIDTFISSYFYYKRLLKTNINMKFWLNCWLEGKIYYGSYFEFYKDWEEIYKQYPEQILWLNYEDLKADLSGEIKKISEFIGVELTEQELEKITFDSTFENMKKTCIDNDPNYNNHLRKGKIGDWKNYFTQEMLDKFNKKLVEYNYPTYEC